MTEIFWVRQQKRLEDDRKLDGFWAPQDFLFKHLGHAVKQRTVAFNSGVVDPATSDPVPVFGTQVTCDTCGGVKSTVR